MDNKKIKTDTKKTEKQNQDDLTKKLETEKLQLEIVELKKQVDEFKNKYLRAIADYQNLEKRVGDERFELMKMANKNLLIKILPFLDNLEKAELFVNDEGLKISKDHFMQILKEAGLVEMDLMNKDFDPVYAEAIDIVEGKEDNKIVEVLKKGYMFEDKIIRVAQVKVSKKI
ncbi:nucleotide exchange factor GrpE [Candidatus Roizmanbacteria bacterium CG06_land_8_20_14_3_00_34_14]|uniref:Protein GrpE n=2 Tax=Candidatus Roizmaniibacteriota TaxID=1752723 RepID=A0A2M7AU89_9BACT|nr:MAG: nucleotide exchange factor GrpE [Candidatus Roizmanbacteria bacterium CG07_land_8_20_14_0_80_34_15]PIU74182.1 MAG: nucleotide exchange factor GrpE [Candidatus Roizmanbacteria bacterium CG06_land_8_20_14_3_00_34_14]